MDFYKRILFCSVICLMAVINHNFLGMSVVNSFCISFILYMLASKAV